MRELSTFNKIVILVEMYYSLTAMPISPIPCTFNWSKELDSMNPSLRHRLKVLRTVCIDGKQTSLKRFNQQVFGDVSTRDCLIIFSEWRGFGSTRLTVRLPPCAETGSYACKVPLSQSIRKNAAIYARNYLGGTGQYLAIMARFERIAPRYWTLSKSENRKLMQRSMEGVLETWKKLKEETSLSKTFLTFDYGKFGSASFKQRNYYDAEDLLLNFHQTIYKGRMSFEEWENSFEVVAHTNQSAYIALLQLEVASSAKCVLLAAHYSNFLVRAFNLYEEKHNQTSSCLKFINKDSGKPHALACSIPLIAHNKPKRKWKHKRKHKHKH